MPDTTTSKEGADKVTPTPPAPQVSDKCKVCGALRGEAPEGIHDYASAFKQGATAGDPKWESPKCWKCGADY